LDGVFIGVQTTTGAVSNAAGNVTVAVLSFPENILLPFLFVSVAQDDQLPGYPDLHQMLLPDISLSSTIGASVGLSDGGVDDSISRIPDVAIPTKGAVPDQKYTPAFRYVNSSNDVVVEPLYAPLFTVLQNSAMA
jgi:hypothetical protein